MSLFEGIDTNQKAKFVRVLTMLFFALIVLVIVFIVNGFKEYHYIGRGVPVVNTITVTGDAEKGVSPDLATFSVGVSVEADTAQKAEEMLAERINPIIAFLKEKGIADKDLKTSNFSIYPRYEYPRIVCITYPCDQQGERTLAGFEATQSLTVKVRDLSSAGTLLAGASEIGATNVSGLAFTVEEKDAIERDVRQEAIEEARQKARDLARDLGVSLGRVVSFSDGNYGYGRLALETSAYGIGGASPKATPEIPVGENTIYSNVTITYEIN